VKPIFDKTARWRIYCNGSKRVPETFSQLKGNLVFIAIFTDTFENRNLYVLVSILLICLSVNR
jgi:hypothetical protein